MSYNCIAEYAETELVIKHSRFIGRAYPVQSTDEAESILVEIRNHFKDASHNCFAYVIDDGHMRCSDDGEPQGLAGTPILSVIKKRELEKVLVTVTRYYGGVKLGGGGLVSAYSTTASSVIEKAGLKTWRQNIIAKLSFNYDQAKIVDSIIKKVGARLLQSEYFETVQYSIAIEVDRWEEMKNTLLSFNIYIDDECLDFL
jgi:uncharacterized YigZ family protein